MNDLTFYKELYVVLTLGAAVLLHLAAAACAFFIKRAKIAVFLNTGLTVLNIALHIFLIILMMYKSVSLDEAVLVMMISLFFHTLICFIHHTVAQRLKRKEKGGEES